MSLHVTSIDEHEAEIEALVAKILTPELTARLKKKLNDELSPLWEYAVDEIVEGAADSVSRISADRAKKFLEAVLAGDVDAARNLFGLTGFDGRGKDHPVIHGKIFEADPIKLRRQLVEAHPDLLRDARIADLESSLAAATLQVADLEQSLYRRRHSGGDED